MNVVGRVGSLISQGVYSVATPFHPFGGAVDVIVVQQPDGSFRSTPWYVRFGKFQGVIKGAEKIVRISVNGIEASFHMYLDNSGEAYFVREVDACNGSEELAFDANFRNNDKGIETKVGVSRLERSVSDTGVAELRDALDSSGGNRMDRAESDGNWRYNEFQEEESSPEGSIVLSEYGSSRYENLDIEYFGESPTSDSEVILVSVDGHILTAPILASDQSTDNVQLDTPQFHLGPGDGDEFNEGTGEITSGDGACNDAFISQLDSCTINDASDNNIASSHVLEVCEGVGEQVCLTSVAEHTAGTGGDSQMHGDSEDASATINKDVYNSCAELPDLAEYDRNVNIEETDSMLEAQHSREKSSQSVEEVDKSEDADVEITNKDVLSPCASESPNVRSMDQPVEGEITEIFAPVIDNVGSERMSVSSTNDLECKTEELGKPTESERVESSQQQSESAVDFSGSDIVDPQAATSAEGIAAYTNMRFEISLCLNELHPSMGLSAAAEVFDAHKISPEDYKRSATSILKNENLVVRMGERYFPWERVAPVLLGTEAFGLDFPVGILDAIPVEQDDILNRKDNKSDAITPSGRRWRLWKIPFRRVKSRKRTSSNSSSEEIFVDTESGDFEVGSSPTSDGYSETPRKQFIRTNVPTNDQVASLDLKDGQNMITFSFSTRVLGTQEVDTHIYLWKWNARIVISDVDGTITKSDVLGQFMPLVGKDWTQSGVVKLFSAIKENGYQLMFLSARAIVQAYITRNFLVNLKQDGEVLPQGPVVISPDGLFPSLFREVIRRAPHEFKIACLEDIKNLFPSDYNPFYAGFGNRDTDELSYRKIGIPKGKIFIINPKGEVAISQHRIDVKSYTSLHTLVNDMFPPTSLVEQEDYNSWNFWKVSLPDIN